MAVSEQTPYIEYVANGVVKAFPLGFDCENQGHLIVTIDDIKPENGQWSLFDGSVVFLIAPINGSKISIQRDTPLERNTDYQTYNNSFRPQPLNKDFDRIWWKLQELLVRLTLLLAALNSKVAAIWVALNKEIQDRIEGDLDIRAWVQVLLNNIASDGILNTLAITAVGSIADLQNLVKWDGRTIQVKSYHTPENFALARPFRGGGEFIYIASRSAENDGVTVFNGWVRLSDVSDINAEDAGVFGDGLTDDTSAINRAKDAAIKNSSNVFFPVPEVNYLITSTIQINEKVGFYGEAGLMLDLWAGKTIQGGSRIKYTGNGAAFQVNPILNPTSTQRRAFGVSFKDLIIEGTSSATHGVKVSDKTNINVAGADLAAFTVDNVYIINFKHGRGLEVNYCFMNQITNFFSGDCAVACTLNHAHNTKFVGGSFQQGLVGLDAISSFDVSLHGTCLQGFYQARETQLGLQMPSDFHIWTGGWDGTGASGVTRTTAAHYSGIGCRVFGSIVNWFGGYEEANNIGYITELDSSLHLYGKYTDLDAYAKYWIQVGIGALTVVSPTFVQGQNASLVGVIHTERNYAAPLNVLNPVFPTTLPVNKQYTGRTASNAGVFDAWNPNTFKYTRTFQFADIVNNGVFKHGTMLATGGFVQEFRETISPTSSGTVTLDLAIGTSGVNFLHVTSGATLTLDFNDINRAAAGTTMKVVIINTHGSANTTVAGTSKFVMSGIKTLPPLKQQVFEFYFDNGAWLEKGVLLQL